MPRWCAAHRKWLAARSGRQHPVRMHGATSKTSPLKDLRVLVDPQPTPGVAGTAVHRPVGEIVAAMQRDGIQLDDHFAWPWNSLRHLHPAALFPQRTPAVKPAE